MQVKQALDELFKNYKFDIDLYKRIIKNNVEFITKDSETKALFGGRLIGCYYVKYTQYDKNIFYNNLFDIDYEVVTSAIDKITSIPNNFKVARDDINLVCFYIAHRFLTNNSLPKDKRITYAFEILNYFSYRTLILISSNYFIYPITEDKAITLTEKLNNKYIIKRVKNWNEYCQYRSNEFLKGKYLNLLTTLNNDKELPNAINDLFSRTKDTLKNIYREFIILNESEDIIKQNKTTIIDLEGKEVIIDRLGTSESYVIKLENLLVSKDLFIKKDFIDVTISIIDSVSSRQLNEALNLILDYMYKDRNNNNKVLNHFKDMLNSVIDYLQKRNLYLGKHNNVINIINIIVGNILYSRGTDISITNIKKDGDKLLREIYKYNKIKVSDKALKNIKNAIYVYIVAIVLVD